MTTIRTASVDDAPATSELYLRGGLDETVFQWVIPDGDARRSLAANQREYTTAWLAGAMSTGEVVLGTEGDLVVGVCVWERIDGAPPQVDSAEAASFLEEAYGEYAPRMATVLGAVAARHPHDEPHWYLQQAIVDPAHRGRGVGGAMIRAHLARTDAEGLATYLEASSPRNRRLYERLGYHPAGDPIVFASDGPPLQPMWRRVP